jgi:hypothetical protein
MLTVLPNGARVFEIFQECGQYRERPGCKFDPDVVPAQ